MPVVRGCVVGERKDRVNDRVCRGTGRRKSPRFDHCGSALLYGSDEFFLQPFFVPDDFVRGPIVDSGVIEIRVLSRGVISPDSHVCDGANAYTGFVCELRAGTIFVQPGHCKPAVTRDFSRVIHRNQAIRIARISNDEHPHIGSSVFFDRLALSDENLAVDPQ